MGEIERFVEKIWNVWKTLNRTQRVWMTRRKLDPVWHCQLEDNGEDDMYADDEEKESASMNNIRQVL